MLQTESAALSLVRRGGRRIQRSFWSTRGSEQGRPPSRRERSSTTPFAGEKSASQRSVRHATLRLLFRRIIQTIASLSTYIGSAQVAMAWSIAHDNAHSWGGYRS